MRTFTDGAGRTWTLSLTIGSAKRVKDKLDINILEPEMGEPPLITRLGTDLLLLGNVICCLLEPQFEAHNVTADDVYDAFNGDTLFAAQKAFYEEMIDFFRKDRPNLSRAVAAQMKMIDTAVNAMAARVDENRLAELVKQEIDELPDIESVIRGAKSGSSQEPSELTPGR